MDDDQFTDMYLLVTKNDEVILPTFSQLVIIGCIFTASFVFIYYTGLSNNL